MNTPDGRVLRLILHVCFITIAASGQRREGDQVVFSDHPLRSALDFDQLRAWLKEQAQEKTHDFIETVIFTQTPMIIGTQEWRGGQWVDGYQAGEKSPAQI